LVSQAATYSFAAHGGGNTCPVALYPATSDAEKVTSFDHDNGILGMVDTDTVSGNMLIERDTRFLPATTERRE